MTKGHFAYLGWKITPEDKHLIDNCIRRLIDEGKIRDQPPGEPLPSLRLQPAMVIARKNLMNALESSPPHLSTDTLVHQLFILSLLVDTAARDGDIDYTGEDGPYKALQVREIELFLRPGEAILRNVSLRISITQYKGNR